MTKSVNWESRIGRRVRLRDLHILFTVIQCGGIAKAASSLGISQPAVSEAVAGLEHAIGARLLDRSRRGTVPTLYANALLRRGRIAFDELRQAVSEIESLSNPSTGEVRIACAESLAASILPPIIQEFRRQYPGVTLQVDQVGSPTIVPALGLPELRERRVDLVLARLATPHLQEDFHDDVNVEILFNDPMVLAVGTHHPLARRRRVTLAELAKEPWILPPPDSLNHKVVAEAFRSCGLAMPKVILVSYSVHLRHRLLTTERFVTAYASTNLHPNGEQLPLKVLPVQLPKRPWPVAIITLKNRTPSPAVERFIDHARVFSKSIAPKLR
jgi:DNA-binding transcriptional LysR family regulator